MDANPLQSMASTTWTSVAAILWSLSNEVLPPTELPLTGCFLFLAAFCVNSRDCCAWKTNWNTLLLIWHQHPMPQSKYLGFFTHSDVWCEQQLKVLTWICIVLHTVLYHMISYVGVPYKVASEHSSAGALMDQREGESDSNNRSVRCSMSDLIINLINVVALVWVW